MEARVATLSFSLLSFSPSSSLSCHLSHLSVHFLSVCLSTCADCFSVLQSKERKSVSPRMAVGTKGSVTRTHQQQTDRQTDRQIGKQTDRTKEKEKKRKEKSAPYISGVCSQLSSGTRGPHVGRVWAIQNSFGSMSAPRIRPITSQPIGRDTLTNRIMSTPPRQQMTCSFENGAAVSYLGSRSWGRWC